MSETQSVAKDANELGEELRDLRTRLVEFRGRL
jgi:hypothetical protein